MIGILKGMVTTLKTLFSPPVTVQYPDAHLPLSPRFRGFPGLLYDHEVDEPLCTGCGACQRNCPDLCIEVTMKENEKFQEGRSTRRRIVDTYYLNLGLCMLCNICVEVCPFDAIIMTKVHELASYSRGNLVADKEAMIQMARDRGEEVS